MTLGASGGIASFVADADGALDSRARPSVHLYGGYRFSNGLSPEVTVFHAGSVTTVAPGLRWWFPVDGRLRPWAGVHAGVGQLTFLAGDFTEDEGCWVVDAGAGLDVMITHALGFGIGGDATFGTVKSERPAGSSSDIGWLTLRAGVGVVL